MKSSKLIIKNIPKSAKEKDLLEFFQKFSTVTNVQLKKTREGVARSFAFVGFNSEEEAELCKTKLDKCFLKERNELTPMN